MSDLPVPLSGTTLLVGPSGVGKTRWTARALDAWLDRHGTDGVVVLEFAPEVVRDGRLLGGRLDRFTTVPDGVWHGVLDAHAPRAETERDAETIELARDNAVRAQSLFDSVPDRLRAVFINDATIPFQHEDAVPATLKALCEPADCVVLNAFKSDELGTSDPVSRQERAALATLERWADRVQHLGP